MPRADLLRRLSAVEGVQRPVGGVVTFAAHEAPEAAAARAELASRRGPFLLTPQPLSVEEWQAQAVAHQQALAERAARIIAGEADPLS